VKPLGSPVTGVRPNPAPFHGTHQRQPAVAVHWFFQRPTNGAAFPNLAQQQRESVWWIFFSLICRCKLASALRVFAIRTAPDVSRSRRFQLLTAMSLMQRFGEQK
jgi:hypothetical protein